MLSKDLKIVGLTITEDYYDYKGLFKLCDEDSCIDIDISDFTDEKLSEIKNLFNLPESLVEIKNEIMTKVLEAAKDECKIVEGTQYNLNTKQAK